MSNFLVAAGPDAGSFPEVFDRFAAEAELRAGPGRQARIAVVVHDSGPQWAGWRNMPAHLQERLACDVVPVLLGNGTPTGFLGV